SPRHRRSVLENALADRLPATVPVLPGNERHRLRARRRAAHQRNGARAGADESATGHRRSGGAESGGLTPPYCSSEVRGPTATGQRKKREESSARRGDHSPTLANEDLRE